MKKERVYKVVPCQLQNPNDDSWFWAMRHKDEYHGGRIGIPITTPNPAEALQKQFDGNDDVSFFVYTAELADATFCLKKDLANYSRIESVYNKEEVDAKVDSVTASVVNIGNQVRGLVQADELQTNQIGSLTDDLAKLSKRFLLVESEMKKQALEINRLDSELCKSNKKIEVLVKYIKHNCHCEGPLDI